MAMNAVRVGIDIEQASMVGAQIRTGRQGHTLIAVSARALPDGLMFEGEVVDVEGLATELKAFWKAAGFTGKRLSVGVANQKIVVRTMEFPIIDPKELRAAIEFQAQEAIPIPLDEAILDFQVLSSTPGEGEGGGRQQVLIVAAQRDMIDQFMQVAKKAGLTVEGIDLQAFALMRSVAPPVAFVDQGAPQADGASALINIGAGISNIVVASGGTPQFTRVVNLGYETLVQAIMQNRGITHQEADLLRLTVGLTGSAASAADLEAVTVERGPRGLRLHLRVVCRRDPPLDRLLPFAPAGRGDRPHPHQRRRRAHAQHVRLPRGRPASACRPRQSPAVHRREQIEAPPVGARVDRPSSGDRARLGLRGRGVGT